MIHGIHCTHMWRKNFVPNSILFYGWWIENVDTNSECALKFFRRCIFYSMQLKRPSNVTIAQFMKAFWNELMSQPIKMYRSAANLWINSMIEWIFDIQIHSTIDSVCRISLKQVLWFCLKTKNENIRLTLQQRIPLWMRERSCSNGVCCLLSFSFKNEWINRMDGVIWRGHCLLSVHTIYITLELN